MTDEGLLERLNAREEVYRGPIFRVERLDVTLPNGASATRDVIRHRGAVAVVAVDGRGYTFLVRQFRAALGVVLTEIPAGKLERADEGHERAAARELREETGLTAGRLEALGEFVSTPGFCDERIWLYLARDLSRHEASPDEDEFLNVVELPFDEAVRMAKTGALCDGKTVAALLLAEARLREEA